MLLSILKRIALASAIVFIFINVSAQTVNKISLKTGQLYSGIEVGSKGVKMSILEMSKETQKTGNYNVVKDTSVNTDFISFTEQTFAATLNALTGLYRVATDQYRIEPRFVFTAISSGVSIQADKDAKKEWLSRLANEFRTIVKEPSRVVSVIDVKEEARLSHLGIIPDSRRFSTFLIDIGSGNTKGGFFPTDNTNDIRLFQLTWGTKSIANATNSRLGEDSSMTNFSRQLQRVLAGSADQEIVYAVNVSGAYNMSDNIAFSGGIAWAVATLAYPELIDNAVVPVSYDEIAAFMERIAKNYNSLSPEAVAKSVSDATVDKKLVAKQSKTVNKVFDQRALLSGTGLLLKIMRQFEGVYEKKQFFLVKNGQVGWISAFVNQAITTQ